MFSSIRRAPALFGIIALLFSSLLLAACSSGVSDTSASHFSSSAQDSIFVTTRIDSTSAGGDCSEEVLSLPQGSTALDALDACSQVEIQDSSFGPFVVSINGLSNGDKGAQSGWCYSVNEQSPPSSAGQFELSDGDVVTWSYVV